MSLSQIVRGIYEAFGRRDVGHILGRLAPDVRWEQPAQSVDAPWLASRTGRAAVGEFFASLGALDFRQFQVTAVIEGGNIVIALVDVEFVVKANGRTVVDQDEVHIWRFDDAGLVTQFRHRLDTHKHALAVA
ncbi:MAG: nuclear transport factor 2 family protein [Alphaproteobacteria bacterium]|nr:nuclear transport factor 2 family protein [Alphaproteobacteria bacterium]